MMALCEGEIKGFNTQPPEGGWSLSGTRPIAHAMFQHTAARRRLVLATSNLESRLVVSTHSRPKAAGLLSSNILNRQQVSTHSRPKAAGPVSVSAYRIRQGFNTQPPEGGWVRSLWPHVHAVWFQHTAARRRLVAHCYGRRYNR